MPDFPIIDTHLHIWDHSRLKYSAFEASPQFAEDAQKARLIDKIGFDDDAKNAALTRGGNAHPVNISKYVKAMDELPQNGQIALITASLMLLSRFSGFAWVSRTIISSFLPLMPPLALMSATAHSAAFTWSEP